MLAPSATVAHLTLVDISAKPVKGAALEIYYYKAQISYYLHRCQIAISYKYDPTDETILLTISLKNYKLFTNAIYVLKI